VLLLLPRARLRSIACRLTSYTGVVCSNQCNPTLGYGMFWYENTFELNSGLGVVKYI
jgi:hypothetical protein